MGSSESWRASRSSKDIPADFRRPCAALNRRASRKASPDAALSARPLWGAKQLQQGTAEGGTRRPRPVYSVLRHTLPPYLPSSNTEPLGVLLALLLDPTNKVVPGLLRASTGARQPLAVSASL